MHSSKVNEYSCWLRKDLYHTFNYFCFSIYGQSLHCINFSLHLLLIIPSFYCSSHNRGSACSSGRLRRYLLHLRALVLDTYPLRPQYVHTLWAPPGVRAGRPSFPVLYSLRDLLKSLGYPVSIAETHPLIAHEPNEVHGWFLSVRALETLSYQSFAILQSLKAANVTLRASSYLRNSGGRNLRNRSSASFASVAGTRSFLLMAIEVSNNSVILIIKFSSALCVACSGRGVASLIGSDCLFSKLFDTASSAWLGDCELGMFLKTKKFQH
ncbi:hypothetical protein M9H77_06867 [Catharanthus roseus]|uniref:Uncharacterized protein n=1 Tax=Catharanthus roseus TaxID=4058 RepID=A0ACC0BTK5_CATRO|nr:hypothetical protein M9H77_06867 [Catharanthus roseus]